SLLFNFTASFMYEGDSPLAERRAQTLALDHAQLRELLGTADYRELLDAEVIESIVTELQRLDRRSVEGADAVHELLLHIGDLTFDEIESRCRGDRDRTDSPREWVDQLLAARRIIQVRIAGEARLIAAEDAARVRDALGTNLPPGLPEAFLESPADPLADLIARFARCRGPFQPAEAAARFGLGEAALKPVLDRLATQNRVVFGEFLPGSSGRECCDAAVLRRIKQRCLARLRKQIEPVEPAALGRLFPAWQGVDRPRGGLDALLDVVDQLQGAPLLASELERSIFPARVADYQPRDLDQLCTAGEIVWRGIEPVGPNDGRVGLFLSDELPLLSPLPQSVVEEPAAAICGLLEKRGAVFFDEIAAEIGGFRNDLVESLWQLVWSGIVTNDTLAPVRSRLRLAEGAANGRSLRRRADRRASRRDRFRSRRRAQIPGVEGRWSLIEYAMDAYSTTQRRAARAEKLLERYGVLVRAAARIEGVEGGFAGLYPILKAMEESGRARRG
ncbi:MAG: crosslink repair DNA glycosylase YcaQ family protein, partial [Planctomycetota bacterium]